MEITEHQANMLRALADGKRMQVVDKKKNCNFEITTLDNFMLFISDSERYEIHIKPDVIVVNGIEVPAPEKVAPAIGTKYYFPEPTFEDYYGECSWDDASTDQRILCRGQVHLDAHGAVAHCKAMLAHMPG